MVALGRQLANVRTDLVAARKADHVHVAVPRQCVAHFLAQPVHQVEAEIRLIALLLEIERDQRSPNQMGQGGPDHRVDQG